MAIRRVNKAIFQKEGGDVIFGEGVDGSATFDGTTTVLSLVPSSSVYKLVKDIYCTNLTVNSGVTLFTNGFRIFVNGTFTNNGTVGMPAAVAHSVSDGSGTISGRQNALNPAKAWGTSTDSISVTDLYDLDDSISGWFITGSGTITKIGGGSLGVAGTAGNVTAATGPFAGNAGTFPGALTGQAGGAGNAGTAGNPATAGTGGAGGLGGGLVIIFAKTIAGSGTIVSYGFAGSSGNPATPGNAGVAGNAAPSITGYHTSGNYPHNAGGTIVNPTSGTPHPSGHNAGAHPHPSGAHPHPDGGPHANPHNAVLHTAAGHHNASNTHAHTSHGHNAVTHRSAPYVLYILGHNGGSAHNAGNGSHPHGVNGHRISGHNGNSNASHGSHASGISVNQIGFSNHNGTPQKDPTKLNAGHGHHAGNHNAGNHPYHHPSGAFPNNPSSNHNGHVYTNAGHGHHHVAAAAHPATNAPHTNIPSVGLNSGHHGGQHHHAGHHPHPAGSHPHPAGSTGPAPHSGTPHPSGHNAGSHPHTAATINVTTGAVTSNRTAAPAHNATNANYSGGTGGAAGSAGTGNAGNPGASGSTGGIIVVTRNPGNVSPQIGHSNYSKVIDI